MSGLCGVPGLVAALCLLFGLLSLCICLVLGSHAYPPPRVGVTAAPKVISMKYGEKLIINYIEAPNETLRDVSDDTEAIVAVLDALKGIHRVFLELLIDLQGSEPLLFSDAGDL